MRLLLIILLFASCKSVKQVASDVEKKEETSSVNIDSLVRERVDSIARFYEEHYKDFGAEVFFNKDCDTVSSIEYLPGRIVKVTGPVSSFKIKESELRKQLNEIITDREIEINKRIKVEEDLKEERSKIKINKKTTVFNLWWLFFVGYVLGYFYPPKKLFTLINILWTKMKR